jgi:hypothetical protein
MTVPFLQETEEVGNVGFHPVQVEEKHAPICVQAFSNLIRVCVDAGSIALAARASWTFFKQGSFVELMQTIGSIVGVGVRGTVVQAFP